MKVNVNVGRDVASLVPNLSILFYSKYIFIHLYFIPVLYIKRALTDCIFVVIVIYRLMDAQTTTYVLMLPETDMT